MGSYFHLGIDDSIDYEQLLTWGEICYRDKLSARRNRVNLIPHRHSIFSFSDFEYADGAVIDTEKEPGSAFVPHLQRLKRLYEPIQVKYATA